MKKLIKLTETELLDIVKKILDEGNFYPPLSKDEIIRKLIPFEDKLYLANLVKNKEKLKRIKLKTSKVNTCMVCIPSI